jgi:hypothetical protein
MLKNHPAAVLQRTMCAAANHPAAVLQRTMCCSPTNTEYRDLSIIQPPQQYFSLRTNQPPAIRQQYFSLRTNQHQSPAKRTGRRIKFPRMNNTTRQICSTLWQQVNTSESQNDLVSYFPERYSLWSYPIWILPLADSPLIRHAHSWPFARFTFISKIRDGCPS